MHYLTGVAANYKVVERIDCLFFYTNVSALFSYKLTMLSSLYNFELSRMLWLELVENKLANPGVDVYGLFLRICYIVYTSKDNVKSLFCLFCVLMVQLIYSAIEFCWSVGRNSRLGYLD